MAVGSFEQIEGRLAVRFHVICVTREFLFLYEAGIFECVREYDECHFSSFE